MVVVARIELTLSGYKPPVLPLNYTTIWRCTQDSNLQAVPDQRFSRPLPHHPDMQHLALSTVIETDSLERTQRLAGVFLTFRIYSTYLGWNTGIEPILSVWKTDVLPLYEFHMVVILGYDPSSSGLQPDAFTRLA